MSSFEADQRTLHEESPISGKPPRPRALAPHRTPTNHDLEGVGGLPEELREKRRLERQAEEEQEWEDDIVGYV